MSQPLRFKPVNPAHEMIYSPDGCWVSYEDYARLKAEVDELTKAGDAMAAVIIEYRCSPWGRKVPNAFTVWQAWFDAKGVQS
jgi:hypothetical protein